jgi:hypothetical protein
VRFITMNGGYDWGWIRSEAGIVMPPSDRLDEIGALATMVDENLFRYSLDALCAQYGLPGKDETLLRQAVEAAGFAKGRKKVNVQEHIWQLPARYVGPYAETDAVRTFEVYEVLRPTLDVEGTYEAYRLEVDLLPMVVEMRLRGIRIDQDAAEQARDLLLAKRDATLEEISVLLGTPISMAEIAGKKWKVKTFDALGITYPRTEKDNPSFKAGTLGWMDKSEHLLPRLIVKANKAHNAATNFLETDILGHMVNGRIHAGIIPLIQMHDELGCSVTSREQGEMIARLGCEAIKLEVANTCRYRIRAYLGRRQAFLGRGYRGSKRAQARAQGRSQA